MKPRLFSKKETLTVKGAAILLMLFYHLFHEAADVENLGVIYAPLSKDLFISLSKFGNICVTLFVFLSAYGLSVGTEKLDYKSIREKSAKRFFNLVLRFAFAFIFSIVCLSPWLNLKGLYGVGPQGALNFLADMTGFSELFGTPTLNMTWWYMPLAYSLIVSVPFVYKLCEKTGWLLILIAGIIPSLLIPEINKPYYMYVMVAVWGVAAAKEGWLDKCLEWKLPTAVKVVPALLAVAVCYFVRQNALVMDKFSFFSEGLIGMVFALAIAVLLTNIPAVGGVFRFLGKYSMNMFLIHSFIYMIIFRNFIYSFKYSALIWLVLTVTSLVVSVIMAKVYDLLSLAVTKIIKRH